MSRFGSALYVKAFTWVMTITVPVVGSFGFFSLLIGPSIRQSFVLHDDDDDDDRFWQLRQWPLQRDCVNTSLCACYCNCVHES